MNPTNKYIRITKDLTLDPSHGLRKGTVWRVGTPPQGASSMRTWVISAIGRPVALLRHEWQEVEIVMERCAHCDKLPIVRRAIKRGCFTAECSSQQGCSVWPMTAPWQDVEQAALAWNRGEFLQTERAVLASAE